MKKAQGISMNVVIIAALALLVLVVLSVIFLTRTGVFSRKTIDCRQNGGICVSASEACPASYPTSYTPWKCLRSDDSIDTDLRCCITG